ncbi:hypothetical protein HQ585_20940 [candidate division KSB1 bacterium]|nr:hypothetical protein [candidate division KSB1 bacterium]
MIHPAKKLIILVFLSLIVSVQSSAYTRTDRSLEAQIAEDIEDYELHDFSRIEAAFILSGVTNPDTLKHYINWYNNLLEKVRAIPFDPSDRPGSASKVFNYLHATWLKNYQLEATTLLDIVHTKTFNCVSSTILYNLICDDLGWGTEGFETPSHVFTIFNNFTQEVMVENTSPMGFNIMSNLEGYTKYLAHYYRQSDVLKIGLDQLYYHEHKNGRRIDNTELLGLLAYNQAYFARKKKNYARAYELIMLAQLFNRDSRSNTKLEMGLYYIWGKKLFEDGKIHQAFEVLADGAYRYPDDPGLVKNTNTAFYRTLQIFYEERNWDETFVLIEEMKDLDILEDQYRDAILSLLTKWAAFLSKMNQKTRYEQAAALYKGFAQSAKD